MSMIKTMYSALGLKFTARLSFHDPHNREKYLGSDELWYDAEAKIEAVAKNAKVTKVDAEMILNTALDTIKKSVKKGDDVTLIGFGTFTKSKRKARIGRNPQTGKEIKIPAMTVPKFRAGREFKDALR
jgi:DNA-binding protein HU-beta